MGRSGTGKHDKAASFRRVHTPVKRPRCPDCGVGAHDFHARGCAWALEHDPGMIEPLGLKDLVGRTLTVIDADVDSMTFTVEGADGETYEACEEETTDYGEDSVSTYTRFEFRRVAPERRWPSPELPKLPVE